VIDFLKFALGALGIVFTVETLMVGIAAICSIPL
jgi:hypothetical protein